MNINKNVNVVGNFESDGQRRVIISLNFHN